FAFKEIRRAFVASFLQFIQFFIRLSGTVGVEPKKSRNRHAEGCPHFQGHWSSAELPLQFHWGHLQRSDLHNVLGAAVAARGEQRERAPQRSGLGVGVIMTTCAGSPTPSKSR